MQNDDDLFDRTCNKLASNTFGKCFFGGVGTFFGFIIFDVFKRIGHEIPDTSSTYIFFPIIWFFIAIFYIRKESEYPENSTIDEKSYEAIFTMFFLIGLAPFIIYISIYFLVEFPDFIYIPNKNDSLEIKKAFSWQYLILIISIGFIISYPVQIFAKYIVPLFTFDIIRMQVIASEIIRIQEEKNRPLINQRIQNEAGKVFSILSEYVSLGGHEALSIIRPLLQPFIDLLCIINGQEAKIFYDYEKSHSPDTYPKDFIQKYAPQFMALTVGQLANVPYNSLKQFYLSVFSDPYGIEPKDLAVNERNLKWCEGWYMEELRKENLSRQHNKQPALAALPVGTELAQEILLHSVIENRSASRYNDFNVYCDDLRLDCIDAALIDMGKSGAALVYGQPLDHTDPQSRYYPIRSVRDCVTAYSQDDIFRHTYIVGKTGSGKTTLLKTLISQHINANQGIILLSPESDLFEAVLDCVPPHRAHEVIYFNPTSTDTPTISVNPFTLEKGAMLYERAGEVYATLEAACGELSDNQKTLLQKCVYTLLQIPGANLQDLRKLLKPAPDFRHAVVGNRNVDEDTREWWRDTYDAKGSKYPTSAEALNRRLEVFSMPPLSSTLSSASFNFSEALNGQKSIVLLDLSRLKGLQAEITGQLLSSMVLQTLLARDSQKPQERLPYHFIIDEFQTYAGDNSQSFIDLFNRARKYRMSITLAHQITANIPSELLSTIIGNAGTKIIMERPNEDAAMFAKELQIRTPDRETYNGSILQNLKPHEFFLSTPRNKIGMILQTIFKNYQPVNLPATIQDGSGQQITLHSREEWREVLIAYSRKKYGKVAGDSQNTAVVEDVKTANAKNKQQDKPEDDDPEGNFSIL